MYRVIREQTDSHADDCREIRESGFSNTGALVYAG